MRTLNRITEEFVRCHRSLVEQTGNEPSKVGVAYGEFPDFAANMARLHEIDRAVERHRHFGERPFIVQAHPDFRRALKDFRDRWTRADSDFRADARVKPYQQAALRAAEEFMRWYDLLVEWAADDPSAIEDSGRQQPELAYAFGVLDAIRRAASDSDKDRDPFRYGDDGLQLVSNARELGRRLIAEAPPKYQEALDDFGARWRDCFRQLEAEGCSVPPLSSFLDDAPSEEDIREREVWTRAREEWGPAIRACEEGQVWLEKLLCNLPDAPLFEDATHFRPFDPGRDSAADTVMRAEDIFVSVWQEQGGARDLEYKADEAFEWLHETKGFNLYEIECRMKEFPDIIVPQQVSDHYGLEEPRRLFASLSQLRLAYIIGADLPAIALCRSLTELLVRHHYARDIPGAANSRKTRLRWLVEQLQSRQEFDFLRNFNLVAKVNEANDILHQAITDIEHRDHDRGLVTEWVRVLEEMIDRAPTGRSATTMA